MKINITCPSRYKIDRKVIREAIGNFVKQKNLPLPENSVLNVVFIGRNKMKALASKYKGENEALPVLTFPMQEKMEDELLLGEIVICYPSAVLMAAQKEKTVNKIIEFLLNHALNVLFKI